MESPGTLQTGLRISVQESRDNPGNDSPKLAPFLTIHTTSLLYQKPLHCVKEI